MRYIATSLVTVSLFTEVAAENEEEAIAIAESRDIQGLCHQCSGGNASVEWSLSGELDGIPEDIEVDK